MHPLETEHPRTKETAAWLNARPWINQHYHIRCPPRVLSPSSRNLVTFYSRVFACEEPNPHSDMSRLARFLTGQAVGLVLGGGGAKGGAHVGIIRAFQVTILSLCFPSSSFCIPQTITSQMKSTRLYFKIVTGSSFSTN